MRRTLYNSACILILLTFAINALAMRYGWYPQIHGFDKLLHTLGGATSVVLLAAFFTKRLFQKPTATIFWNIVLGALIIGVCWELFEYAVQFLIKGATLARPIDSLGDILFDVIGAMFGARFVLSIKKRYTTTNDKRKE